MASSSAIGGMTLNASPLNEKAPSISSLGAALYVASVSTATLATSYILQASSKSTSAAQGGLVSTVRLAANVAVRSVATGAPTVDFIVGSTVVSASGATGNLVNTAKLAGNLTSNSTASSSIQVAFKVAASAQSVSDAQGNVVNTAPIAGNAATESKSTAGINVDYIVAGDAQSNVIATSNLARIVILQSGWSTAAVNTSPLGSATLHSGDAGVVSADSTANATLSVWNALEAFAKVESWAFGALFSTIPLADVAGTGSVSNAGQANLDIETPLTGQVEVVAVSTASTTVHFRLDAVALIDSQSSGAVVLQSPLQGQIAAQSELAGNITLVSPIGSESVVASASSAGLVNTIPMDAVIHTISRSDGAVKVDYVVSGNVVTLVSMGGGLTNTIPMGVAPDTGAVASSDGGIVLRIPFDAAAQGVVSTTANARKFHSNPLDTLRPTGADVLHRRIAAELSTATGVYVNRVITAEVNLIQPTLYKRAA